MTERQLIEACLRNDRIAQRTLYDRYSKAMYSTAYRITADFGLAGEAIQDAFLQVFRHLERFEGRSTLGAWIKVIVVRTAIGKMRRQRLFFQELEPKHEAEQIDWGGNSMDAEYLEQAILSLPEGYRTVFLLAEVEGFAHREIAEMLGISEGTSKSQLWNAKKRLQNLLQDYMLR